MCGTKTMVEWCEVGMTVGLSLCLASFIGDSIGSTPSMTDVGPNLGAAEDGSKYLRSKRLDLFAAH